MKRKITIGTRGSRLAVIQTETVAALLKKHYPKLVIDIEKIVTSGDRDRVTHLDRIGVDVFVKELEEALLAGKIDIAVHSLKDVPTEIPEGLGLIAFTEREDPRDVLAAKVALDELPPGAKIATGSLRRTIQLRRLRPDLEICGIRGNVDTRVRKVAHGEADGVILAAAGLKRLGLAGSITQYLDAEVFLPAAGQGALAMEGRVKDKAIIDMVMAIDDLPTRRCVTAERAFLKELGGGCRAPVAALSTIDGDNMILKGMAAGSDGEKVIYDFLEGTAAAPEETGIRLAQKMLDQGAGKLIDEARNNENR